MNFTEVELEGLESSLEHWMLSDPIDAEETFGDSIISAIQEVLDYE